MAITLRFGVKPGDKFRYQATFSSQRDGKATKSSVQNAEQVVAVDGDKIHVVDPGDPERLVTVYDRRGFPIDILQGGASVKDEMPPDVFDISNRLIFPDGPVSEGDTWTADDGTVHLTFQLIGISKLSGRDVAEVHGIESSYTGPIKFWVELATGLNVRKEYIVGDPIRGTTTVIERI